MEKITLKNGTRVILDGNSSVRSCNIGIFIASGPRYEAPENSGAAHFIEHMLFKGTPTRTALQIAEQMDEIGGMMNAYTTKEFTCFYARCLTEHSETAFDILGDMITSPLLRQEDIELEKGVIKEEIAMYEDSPEDLCADVFNSRIWPKDMLGANTCGTRESVDSMNREKLLAHMNEFYVPERTVISIGGNFDKKDMLAKCDEYFGKKKPGGNPLTASTPEYRKCFTCIKKDFEQNQLILAFPGLSLSDEAEHHAARLLISILGASSSSRLFQRIREELGLAYAIDCDNAAYQNAGVFVVTLALAEKSEQQALKQTIEIIASFAGSITEKELARAKEQTVAGLIMGLESGGARASYNGRNELLLGRIVPDDETVKAIRAVTLENVKTLAEKLFDFSKVSLCVVGKVHSERWYKEQIKKCLAGVK